MNYEEFVDFLFQRHEEDKEWYFAEDFVPPKLNSETQVLYARQIFKNAEAYAKTFTERQFCLGLTYLINPAASWHCYSYLEPSVDEAVRLSVFDSMYDVFSFVFNQRCREAVSNRADLSSATYGYMCYMWWDVFPRHGVPFEAHLQETDRAIQRLLAKQLTLQSVACKESALHGLGHWHAAFSDFVEKTIAGASLEIPESLKEYAKRARIGDVQ